MSRSGPRQLQSAWDPLWGDTADSDNRKIHIVGVTLRGERSSQFKSVGTRFSPLAPHLCQSVKNRLQSSHAGRVRTRGSPRSWSGNGISSLGS